MLWFKLTATAGSLPPTPWLHISPSSLASLFVLTRNRSDSGHRVLLFLFLSLSFLSPTLFLSPGHPTVGLLPLLRAPAPAPSQVRGVLPGLLLHLVRLRLIAAENSISESRRAPGGTGMGTFAPH